MNFRYSVFVYALAALLAVLSIVLCCAFILTDELSGMAKLGTISFSAGLLIFSSSVFSYRITVAQKTLETRCFPGILRYYKLSELKSYREKHYTGQQGGSTRSWILLFSSGKKLKINVSWLDSESAFTQEISHRIDKNNNTS